MISPPTASAFSKRVLLSSVLIALAGIVSINLVHFIEEHTVGAIGNFMEQNPALLPDNLSDVNVLISSILMHFCMAWMFVLLYQLALPSIADRGAVGAVLLGLICWAGFYVPLQVTFASAVRTHIAIVLTNLAGWLLMLVFAGLIAHRVLSRQEVESQEGTEPNESGKAAAGDP